MAKFQLFLLVLVALGVGVKGQLFSIGGVPSIWNISQTYQISLNDEFPPYSVWVQNAAGQNVYTIAAGVGTMFLDVTLQPSSQLPACNMYTIVGQDIIGLEAQSNIFNLGNCACSLLSTASTSTSYTSACPSLSTPSAVTLTTTTTITATVTAAGTTSCPSASLLTVTKVSQITTLTVTATSTKSESDIIRTHVTVSQTITDTVLDRITSTITESLTDIKHQHTTVELVDTATKIQKTTVTETLTATTTGKRRR